MPWHRSDIPLQFSRYLPDDAHFVERYDVRLEDLHAIDDKGTTFIPPLVILLKIERYYAKAHCHPFSHVGALCDLLPKRQAHFWLHVR
ncbi:hypothetical protein [Bradyrhizobium sp. AUGA SZCCT0283]|uniref:hypothetical protein n=1 Tax=Bradyrhizobium sp. AUGA SZCCT0283 TaxID=2807671 RepID=UPI001BA7A5B9|nr:hypothetical protein [Bradyrhizobium sp. AUGA SZCCT0283]MBR1278423.1 hypothetical protein [Bradyrhizobium sp. AUGA SZCCT0283]